MSNEQINYLREIENKQLRKVVDQLIKENKQLKEQLSEKDREIERLKQENDKLALALAEEPDKDELLQLKQDFDILYNKTKERDRSIRKQVCDEIRDKCIYVAGTKRLCENTSVSTYNLNEILDQIEQAKESIKWRFTPIEKTK